MENFGLAEWAMAAGLFLILTAVLGGAFMFIKEGYQRRLGQGHTKPKATVLALWDYLVVDLLRQAVLGVIMLAFLVFFFGGFIGLWILG